MKEKTVCLFFAALLAAAAAVSPARAGAGNRTFSLSSPDGKLSVGITCGERLSFFVTHLRDTVLSPSDIGLVLADGTVVGRDCGAAKAVTVFRREHVTAPFYRQREFDVSYNETDIRLSKGFGVKFRAYDGGVAYRFYTLRKGETVIKNETASFAFAGNPTAYLPYTTSDGDPLAMAYQNTYDVTKIPEAADKPAFLPVALDLGSVKLAILESDLEAYPGMFLEKGEGGRLEGVFARYPAETDFYPALRQEYVTKREDYIARSTGARRYPWRVLAVTEDDRDMPVNNLVYALASENRIGDTSWIRPGKVAWDWWNDWNLTGVPFKTGINTETYKYYIDFAAEYGLDYVILDEGWYPPDEGDMMTPSEDVDLPELVEYAAGRGVGIILWTVFNVLDGQMEEACEKYSAMGVKGFKVDFLDRDDQTAVEMVYRVAEAAARHRLMLDFHGIYKPTGLNRTYPNVVNFESVFGMEEMRWATPERDMPLYDVTFPYIRMMAGPVDYTPGAMRNATREDWRAVYRSAMSMGTRCHQLAAYVVHDAPLVMLCDAPTVYERERECTELIASLPVVYDSTFVAAGRMGEYIVTARVKDGRYYLGGMTNWDERDVVLDMSFLPEGKSYDAVIFADGVNAAKQAQDYRVEKTTADARGRIPVHMAPGGGFVMALSPAAEN